jgi:MFS transporter, ACS family, hexuronate transporter
MSEKVGTYRWRIIALLFFATTINYIDRQIIGILAPQLQSLFNWTEKDYSYIIMGFQLAYAIGLVTTGGILDKIGTKIGYAFAIAIWSLSGMFHAVAKTVLSFVIARFTLGFGESANFPAAIKTVTEWFPRSERALATGVFNSGSSIGAIITPLIVPLIALNFGWQSAFILTGGLGIVWLLFWIPFYKNPKFNKRLTATERDFILQDNDESTEKVRWKKIFPHKQTLGICLARFVTDPIWWFFLFWLPKFLFKSYGIDLSTIGLPLFVIYTVSIGGAIAGGWISSFFIKNGKNPVASRKLAILLSALLVIPIFFASQASNIWIAVVLISFAVAGHQAYASNIFTIVSDVYPKNAIGSMIGLSGFAGAIGGILFAGAVGWILDKTGSYYVIFGIASLAYLICWLMLVLFVPNNKKVIIE